jgi:hypothetical protein
MIVLGAVKKHAGSYVHGLEFRSVYSSGIITLDPTKLHAFSPTATSALHLLRSPVVSRLSSRGTLEAIH